jgi:hypothetical protein
MADNVIIPAQGTGDTTPTIAADDVGGAKYQRVKISVGADGVVGDATAANPLPISGPVTSAAASQADGHSTTIGGTNDAAWVSGAGSAISILKGIFGRFSLGHGTAAAAIRVELPTDGTGVVGLATGANTIGALTANQSINNAQIAGNAAAVNSGNLSAGVQRVTLATDQVQLTNALKVDPSAVTSPVSLASVPSHAVTNAGTFAVQATEARATTGAAPTAFTATTSTQVFASNANRKRFTIYNNSDQDCFLMFASAAVSATSYHVIVKANGGFFSDTDYSGEIRGIMAATINTGQVNPGEFT